MRPSIRLSLLPLLLSFSVTHAASSEQSLIAMRKTFQQAEQYIAENREQDYFVLSDSLKNYPLYPYLQYHWLTDHLDDSDAVLAFLHNYPNSRYAALLHNQWLRQLGESRQWLPFLRYYKNSGNIQLQCYFAQAQYHIGETNQPLEKAKQLWLSGKIQPKSCSPLFEWLRASSGFGPDMIWQRFHAALERNNEQLAAEMRRLLAKDQQNTAELWIDIHRQPQRIAESAAWQSQFTQPGLLFNHAIRRWLDKDVLAALKVWDEQHRAFDLPLELAAETEKRLAMQLAFQRDSRAYSRLSEYAGKDPSAQEWRIRAALNQQNWPGVLAGADALGEAQKKQDKWQYWRAKALAATGNTTESQAILQRLANNRSFYAFLAAHQLGKDIALNHRPVSVTAGELLRLQSNAEFQVVSELLALDRKEEAAAQWWHAVAGLDARQLTVAARLAQIWQWPSIAIFTIAKAENWDDMALRFPLPFKAPILEFAQKQQLDPALVSALIRQESAFDEFAGSPAGAIGLMQLMPTTAKQIAGELKESFNNPFNLLVPEINIKYGSAYFKKMLDRYSGHYVPAIAAYNAGPNRVQRWLPDKQAMPADIWIETIPYKETRAYVASVIMYAMIYQQRLTESRLKLSSFLSEVKPN